MNRIKFDAKILDLYSVDYEYLQDSIEDEVTKLLRQTIANPGQSGVIKGFKLKVSPADNTKVMIYSDGTWNSAISAAGIMVEIEDNIDLIAPSSISTPGTLNYVYIRSYTADGTYNKTAEVIEEGVQKAIDYYAYTRVYDRQLDKWEVVVYINAEYLTLTEVEQNELIYIGYFIDGTRIDGIPISSVGTSGRYNATTFIADSSVTTATIATDDMLLLQTNVDNSITIYDKYPVTFEPENLEEDLNKIRSIVRGIRGTSVWDENDSNNLKVFDATINALHSNGVLPTWNDYDVIPGSTGLSVIVQTGKALIDGVMQTLSSGNEIEFTIEEQTSYPVIGEGPHVAAVLNKYFELDHPFATNLIIYALPATIVSSNYYELDSSTGRVYTRNINFVGDTVYCNYDYGYQRFDVIEVGPDLDIQLVQGISGTSTGLAYPDPVRPPAIPIIDEGYLPLSIIKVTPNMPGIASYDIEEYKRFSPLQRDFKFISSTDISTVQTTINKITYHKSNYVLDTYEEEWTEDTYENFTFYKSNTLSSFITSAILTTEDDELWIIVDKDIWNASIKIQWNSEPDADYDEDIDIDLKWRYPLHYQPILITKGLSAGIHKIKIKVDDAYGTGQVNFYGLIVGKSDTFYQNYAQTEIETYFNRFLAEETSNNIAIGIDNLPSGNSATKSIAIGYQALKSNTTGNNNIAIGDLALTANTSGINNVAVGTNTLKVNTIGNDNVGIGYHALDANVDGINNIAVGTDALGVNITGDGNIAIGKGALASSTNNDNIAIGRTAGSAITTETGTIVIGDIAGGTGSNRTYIDNIDGDTVTLPNITPISPNVAVDANGRLQKVLYTGAPPIGSIIAYLPGYFTSLGASYVTASPALTLPPEWKPCNGDPLADADSPIFTVGAPTKYLPNLTNDIFLMGTAAPGGVSGGSNNLVPATQATYTSPNHQHIWGRQYNFHSTQNLTFYKSDGNTAVAIQGDDPAIASLKGAAYGTGGFNVGGMRVTYVSGDAYLYTLPGYGGGACTQGTSVTFAAGANRPSYLSVRYIMRIK